MKNNKIAFSFIAIVAAIAILFSACRKINESTELGGDLIPPVDNITTFDTTITVQAFNDTFGIVTDSIRSRGAEEQWLGKINNDPIFGKTDARMFFELKPPVFKWAFANRPDSLYIDSIVLVLDHIETYGDTNTVQTVNVYELDPTNNFRSDTSYLVRENKLTYSSLLGSKTFAPRILDDSIKARFDTTVGQLRIKLDNAFGTRLLSYDSIGTTGGYSSDSLFRTKFKGFALQSMSSGNAAMGFNLYGENTKLAIYYRANKGGVNKFDTTVSYFFFSSNCASANYITRDYIGTPVQAALGGTNPDAEVFIQNTPGTFATLKIPALATLSNRVIHRAELIVEQKYDISDSTFRPPDYLYLDAFDPSITISPYKFRTIPFDLTVGSSGDLNLGAFGISPMVSLDPFGQPIRVWKFNISRYVQHVLTRTQTLYDLRLFAPLYVFEEFGIPPGTDQLVRVDVNPGLVKGRIRLHGNTSTTDNNPQRIRLRLVYSKL